MTTMLTTTPQIAAPVDASCYSLSSLPLVAFFQFARPAMLGWLLLAAIPLAIYLIFRRFRRTQPWGAMPILREAIGDVARHAERRRRLLLAVRTMLIVVVVLALSRPSWTGGAIRPAGARHYVVAVDLSASMGYRRSDGVTRLDAARRFVRRLIDTAGREDRISLIAVGASADVLMTAVPIAQGQRVSEAIDSLAATDTSLDTNAAIGRIEKLREHSAEIQASGLPTDIYLISDFQQSDWSQTLDAEPSRNLESIYLVDAAELSNAKNRGIVELNVLGLTDSPADNLREIHVRANIGRSETPSERDETETVEVQLWIDGEQVAAKTLDDVSLNSESQTSSWRVDPLTFKASVRSDVAHKIEIRMKRDALSADDRRRFVLPGLTPIRVAIIDGTGRAGGSAGREKDSLRLALWPWAQSTTRDAVRVERLPQTRLATERIDRFDVVFLRDIAALSDADSRALGTFVVGGGSLVMFLDRFDESDAADRYRQLEIVLPGEEMPADLTGVGMQSFDTSDAADTTARVMPLIPMKVESSVETARPGIDPLEYRHPMFDTFRGAAESGLASTPIGRYFRLVPSSNDSSVEVVARVADGDPLIVEQAIGPGRILVIATSDRAERTPFAAWPTFPSLVQELVRTAARDGRRRFETSAGQSLGGTLVGQAGQIDLSVTRPDGTTTTEQLAPRGDWSVWRYRDTDEAGFYTVKLGKPAERIEQFAVNVPARESRLTQVDFQMLQKSGLGTRRVKLSADGTPVAAPISEGRRSATAAGLDFDGYDTTGWFLYLAAGLFLFESMIARRFAADLTKK